MCRVSVYGEQHGKIWERYDVYGEHRACKRWSDVGNEKYEASKVGKSDLHIYIMD